jgi:hypothetical protein
LSISKDDVFTALIQKNYFPAQKKMPGELPPIFTTEGITQQVSDAIKKLETRKKQGFDCVNYASTRFDLVPRILQIPFPKGYIDLCFCIRDNWDKISHISNGSLSAIKPAKHTDGRIIVMDYEDRVERDLWHIENSFAKKFGVHSDISSFYPSIYTHSIGWAVAGQQTAKASNGKQWYDNLDKYQRYTTRNETKGIPIGPATSNIIAEIILQKIDSDFHEKTYRRYIDDYQGYFLTREEAEVFVRELRLKLRDYGLLLHPKKTKIYELPYTSDDNWMHEIHQAVPKGYGYSFSKAKQYIDYIIHLQKKYPDKSVIKYGIKCILKSIPKFGKSGREHYSNILKYIIRG